MKKPGRNARSGPAQQRYPGWAGFPVAPPTRLGRLALSPGRLPLLRPAGLAGRLGRSPPRLGRDKLPGWASSPAPRLRSMLGRFPGRAPSLSQAGSPRVGPGRRLPSRAGCPFRPGRPRPAPPAGRHPFRPGRDAPRPDHLPRNCLSQAGTSWARPGLPYPGWVGLYAVFWPGWAGLPPSWPT
jgi:hypothetical protein